MKLDQSVLEEAYVLVDELHELIGGKDVHLKLSKAVKVLGMSATLGGRRGEALLKQNFPDCMVHNDTDEKGDIEL